MLRAMNWYFEKQGVSQGPFSEEAMIGLLQHKEMAAETLIWQAGLEAWASVQQVKPEWLTAAPAAAPKPVFKRMQTGLPVSSTPPILLPKPKAGIEPGAAGAPATKKRGFLQRLFGFGKNPK